MEEKASRLELPQEQKRARDQSSTVYIEAVDVYGEGYGPKVGACVRRRRVVAGCGSPDFARGRRVFVDCRPVIVLIGDCS